MTFTLVLREQMNPSQPLVVVLMDWFASPFPVLYHRAEIDQAIAISHQMSTEPR